MKKLKKTLELVSQAYPNWYTEFLEANEEISKRLLRNLFNEIDSEKKSLEKRQEAEKQKDKRIKEIFNNCDELLHISKQKKLADICNEINSLLEESQINDGLGFMNFISSIDSNRNGSAPRKIPIYKNVSPREMGFKRSPRFTRLEHETEFTLLSITQALEFITYKLKEVIQTKKSYGSDNGKIITNNFIIYNQEKYFLLLNYSIVRNKTIPASNRFHLNVQYIKEKSTINLDSQFIFTKDSMSLEQSLLREIFSEKEIEIKNEKYFSFLD